MRHGSSSSRDERATEITEGTEMTARGARSPLCALRVLCGYIRPSFPHASIRRLSLLALLALASAALLSAASAADAPALPSATAAPSSEPVALAWRLAPGEKLRYRMTQEQIQRVSGAEQMTTLQRQVVVFTQEVTGVDAAGAASITARYEAVKLDVDRSRAGARISWDSTRPEDRTRPAHPAVRPLTGLVGLVVSYRISPEGKVTDARGFEKIVDLALEPLAGNPAASGAASQLRKSFGNEAMARQLETAFGVVPPRPVPQGATWTSAHEQEVPSLGTIRFDHAFRLASVETIGGERRARIAMRSSVTRTAEAGGAADNPMTARMTIELEEGGSQGECWFSLERGRIVRTTLATTMEMLLRMKPRPGAPADAGPPPEMRQEVDQRTTLELIPLDGPPF